MLDDTKEFDNEKNSCGSKIPPPHNFSNGPSLTVINKDIASLRGRRSKGRGRELGRETAREGGGRRGTPVRKPLFSPSQPTS